MDTLDNDTTNLICEQLSTFDRLRLYNVLDIPRPTQFHVSSKLLASKELRGIKGLMMRVITKDQYFRYDIDRFYEEDGFIPCDQTASFIKEQLKIDNYEPCFQLTKLLQKHFEIEPWSCLSYPNEGLSNGPTKLLQKPSSYHIGGPHKDIRMIYWQLAFVQSHGYSDAWHDDEDNPRRTGLNCIDELIQDMLGTLNDYYNETFNDPSDYYFTEYYIDSDDETNYPENNIEYIHEWYVYDSDNDNQYGSDIETEAYFRGLRPDSNREYYNYCEDSDSDSDQDPIETIIAETVTMTLE
jgi:hypothetical protein